MQFMIYHIYSVQKQHNGKEAFSRGLTTVWINCYVFTALVANCSLLKAQEEDQDNDGEEGQMLLSNCSNIVNFSVSTKLYSILRLHSECFVQLRFCLISTQILHQESFICVYWIAVGWQTLCWTWTWLRAFLWTQFSKSHKNLKDKFDSQMRIANRISF